MGMIAVCSAVFRLTLYFYNPEIRDQVAKLPKLHRTFDVLGLPNYWWGAQKYWPNFIKDGHHRTRCKVWYRSAKLPRLGDEKNRKDVRGLATPFSHAR